MAVMAVMVVWVELEDMALVGLLVYILQIMLAERLRMFTFILMVLHLVVLQEWDSQGHLEVQVEVVKMPVVVEVLQILVLEEMEVMVVMVVMDNQVQMV